MEHVFLIRHQSHLKLTVKIDSRELIAGTVTALVIALIIIIILGIMSKASKSKN